LASVDSKGKNNRQKRPCNQCGNDDYRTILMKGDGRKCPASYQCPGDMMAEPQTPRELQGSRPEFDRQSGLINLVSRPILKIFRQQNLPDTYGERDD
jgi:hypothetical protein